ncbi:hypothetical protein [Nannocystis bainbridge]|uniref:Uncharacterized protein n=1 Tax=Nannocystis bainbridge TaxID=2995303 RepID=A0ABT5EEM7_9BACT|nr:hypothetical protein [Nannocystis bainbridge]MDC0723286.1 hypothetical protein [Nannocystis bainbridge]
MSARRSPIGLPAKTCPPAVRRPSAALAAALALHLSFETHLAHAADLSLRTSASTPDLSAAPSPARAADLSLRTSTSTHDLSAAPSPARAADLSFRTSNSTTSLSFATIPAPRHLARATLPAPASSLHLSLETAPPSPRDLAYEQGQAAKEAADDPRAADEFARAYRLTPPGETGPRLMLLRESVDARLRAHERGAPAPEQLCPARALLREHLAGADPLTDERSRLARVEQGLGAVDCDAPDRPVPQDIPTDPPRAPAEGPPPGPVSPAPPDSSSPADAPPSPVPMDMSSRSPASTRGRGLRIAGAAALGLGAAALVPMSVGIALARDATRDGRHYCWGREFACDGGIDPQVDDILKRGYKADTLVKIAAPVAGIALLTGAVLLGVGLAMRARAPVAVAPRLGPGTLGLGLQGRF